MSYTPGELQEARKGPQEALTGDIQPTAWTNHHMVDPTAHRGEQRLWADAQYVNAR